MKLSIIIPCYNESLSINSLVDSCKSIIEDDIEIILVDNGSTDGTYDILKQIDLPKQIIPIRIKKNIGYGNGILKGLENARGEVLSWTHADLQTDPRDVVDGYILYQNEIISKKCIVKGVRKNRNFIDSFFTFCMSLYTFSSLGVWLYDINAQPKIFHRDLFKYFDNAPLDFSLDLFALLTFKKLNITTRTFEVYFKKRKFGEAKGGGSFKGKFKLIKRTLNYINQLKNGMGNM